MLSRVLQFVRSGWPQHIEDLLLKPFLHRRYELSIEQDCLVSGIRVVIPIRYQKDILAELHVGHPGIVRMKELARSYLWWPNIDSEIEQTVRNCSSCQQVRKPPAAAPLAPWMWPSNPWHRIHIERMRRGTISFSLTHTPGGPRFSTCREVHRQLQRSLS